MNDKRQDRGLIIANASVSNKKRNIEIMAGNPSTLPLLVLHGSSKAGEEMDNINALFGDFKKGYLICVNPPYASFETAR